MKIVSVQTGDILVSQDCVFQTSPIGSGIVACLYDASKKMGGICCTLFGTSRTNSKKYTLFLTQALPLLLQKMIQDGCNSKTIQAHICGGAQIFNAPPLLQWQQQEFIEDLVKTLDLQVTTLDIGGNKSRTIELNCSNGSYTVNSMSAS